MSENKENKLTLINEKTANDYLTHTALYIKWTIKKKNSRMLDGILRMEMEITDYHGEISFIF